METIRKINYKHVDYSNLTNNDLYLLIQDRRLILCNEPFREISTMNRHNTPHQSAGNQKFDQDEDKNDNEGLNQANVQIEEETHDHTTTQTKQSNLSHRINEIKGLLIENAQENNEKKIYQPCQTTRGPMIKMALP
jgi:hypothetical protein